MKHIVLSVLLTLSSGLLIAQLEGNFEKKIIGNWQGTGSLFGMEASFTMDWSSELNDQFIKLEFENSFKDGSGNERKMNAQAYYDLQNNKGVWFDSRGLTLPLDLDLKENTLTVLWGEAASEQGKTIYSLVTSKKVEVKDFVLRNGEYAHFATAEYVRIE